MSTMILRALGSLLRRLVPAEYLDLDAQRADIAASIDERAAFHPDQGGMAQASASR